METTIHVDRFGTICTHLLTPDTPLNFEWSTSNKYNCPSERNLSNIKQILSGQYIFYLCISHIPPFWDHPFGHTRSTWSSIWIWQFLLLKRMQESLKESKQNSLILACVAVASFKWDLAIIYSAGERSHYLSPVEYLRLLCYSLTVAGWTDDDMWLTRKT